MLGSRSAARARWGILAAAAALAGCHTDPYCPGSLGRCPATVPANGAPCSGPSPIGGCEYGDDPSYVCNMIAVCGGSSGWQLQDRGQPWCGTTYSPPQAPIHPGCPATRPHVGTPCGPPCTSWGSGSCDNQSMICDCGVWQLVECLE